VDKMRLGCTLGAWFRVVRFGKVLVPMPWGCYFRVLRVDGVSGRSMRKVCVCVCVFDAPMDNHFIALCNSPNGLLLSSA
jgi:hypothetical protein